MTLAIWRNNDETRISITVWLVCWTESLSGTLFLIPTSLSTIHRSLLYEWIDKPQRLSSQECIIIHELHFIYCPVCNVLLPISSLDVILLNSSCKNRLFFRPLCSSSSLGLSTLSIFASH
jgi:hypothetical protein